MICVLPEMAETVRISKTHFECYTLCHLSSLLADVSIQTDKRIDPFLITPPQPRAHTMACCLKQPTNFNSVCVAEFNIKFYCKHMSVQKVNRLVFELGQLELNAAVSCWRRPAHLSRLGTVTAGVRAGNWLLYLGGMQHIVRLYPRPWVHSTFSDRSSVVGSTVWNSLPNHSVQGYFDAKCQST